MKPIKIENSILFQGDCLEVMKTIPDNSVDMILCDLPYGTTACKWDNIIPFEPLWEQYNRLIKDNGAIVLFGTEPFSSMLRTSNLKMYKYDWVWVKNRPSGMGFCKYQPLRATEILSVFYKTPKYYPIMVQRTEQQLKRFNKTKTTYTSGCSLYGFNHGICKCRENSNYKYPSNVLNFKVVSNSSKEKTKHPTQKPVDLLEYLIKTYTKECETVLDNCMGSGSTGVACKNTNRHFIGIELDKNYFEIAVERIKGEQNDK